ncbi:ATP-binding protein [Ornithinimicrobium sediminis]|uniref:ATP-binding protein n=1 Tax=Ornithinimicrobium sediminis TaxID=2904603 RepID=UPI001E4049B3|nr:ATP-binding protein [Ornithinimicrobium sediminis]MCE0487785.1 ATP-binding protein [Ornithinimicrobium sediminis]
MTATAQHSTFYSVDGRGFAGDVSLGTPLLVGDFLVLESPGIGQLVGQVLGKQVRDGAAHTTGVVRGALDPDGSVGPLSPVPFADAQSRPAPPEVLAAFQESAGADMLVGHATSGSREVSPVRLRHKGFARHTFVCGQSGSGKTYALGVVLEQVLAETGLPLVVLDPNGDYVHLGTVREGADPERVARLGSPDIQVLRAGPVSEVDPAAHAAVRFVELSPAAKAATLRLDPVQDRREYQSLMQEFDVSPTSEAAEEMVHRLRTGGAGVDPDLSLRIRNLGLLEWDIWSRGHGSLLDVVDQRPRGVVLDVSRCEVPQERSIAALALVDHLWARREQRRPVLLVIDEAHNFCTAEPADAVQAAVTDRLVQIAAEGRKYGIWLVLSTQQPHKIHPNVLSQCDNLVLMRMNSTADLAHLGDVFGTAPPQMLSAATSFRQGEMLLAGGFVAAPVITRVAQRLTVEGGSDVPVPPRGG